MGSGGLPQSKEFEILFSKGFNNGNNFLRSNGIMNLGELNLKLDEIRTSTDSLRGWMGHSYKYWKSYIDDTTSFNALSKTTIPVLIIAGSRDESTPIESVMFSKNQLEGHVNIRFEIIPDVDHRFIDINGRNLLPTIYKSKILGVRMLVHSNFTYVCTTKWPAE